MIFGAVLGISIVWFFAAAAWALTHDVGSGTLLSLEPFYSPPDFSRKLVMAATPIAVLSFLGFDGISTLAEDAREPQKNIGRATLLACFIVGGLFILQTYAGQLLWPGYSTFASEETAFSEIGRKIGGPVLGYVIVLLVVAQAWMSGITSQASASRLLYAMARDGRLPRLLFGYLHPQRRTPTYSMLLMGFIAMTGAMLLDLGRAAELVSFGACAGFMAVNCSVIGEYFVRRRARRAGDLWPFLVSPAIGFCVCSWIWLSISPLALSLGVLWSLAGLVYLGVTARYAGAAARQRSSES
ncbi:MAG: APC family permease, partial [Burkholderiaceae bacterium]